MRKCRLIVSVLLVISLLAGVSVAAADIELSYMHMFGQAEIQEFFDDVIAQYEELYPGVKVTQQYSTFDTINQQLTVNVASGTVPDITFLNNPDFAAYVEMGSFADIDEMARAWEDVDQFYEGVIAAGTVNGKIYGFPFDTNCLCVFYNKDALDAAGVAVPQTMDELIAAAKALTDPSKGQYGLIISGKDSEETTFQFMPFLYSYGGTFDKVNSDEAIAALQMYVDLINEGAMTQEIVNMGQGDIRDRWIAGQAAMMVNGTWEVSTMKNGVYEDLDFAWGVTKIPAGPAGSYSCMGGKIIGCGNGAHVEESFNFIKVLCSKENMLEFAKRIGAVPCRADVAEDSFWTEDPEIAVFVDQMATAVPRGPHKSWPEISQAIRVAITSALSGGSSVPDALNLAQETIDALLN